VGYGYKFVSHEIEPIMVMHLSLKISVLVVCLSIAKAADQDVMILSPLYFSDSSDPVHIRYMESEKTSSALMGSRCEEFTKENLPLLNITLPRDEFMMTEAAVSICKTLCQALGFEFNVTEFLAHRYNHTSNVLTDIFQKHISDKRPLIHNYGHYYHRYLDSYRKLPSLRYLELGVYLGESLRSFREYFPNADRLVGIDLSPEVLKSQDEARDIYVHVGHQTDEEFLKYVNGLHGPFDIIIDDCSHIGSLTIRSFEILFPLLNNHGVYVIEDTVAFRESLPYFQNLTMHLSKWRRDYGGDHISDPRKIEITTTDPIEYSVGDIVFSNSCILIFKDIKYHWIPRD